MSRYPTLIAAAAAVLVALLALPAAGFAASPLGGFKRAKFLVTAKGTQVTTWSYRHTGVPGAICDFDATGSGKEIVSFHTTKAVTVTAFGFGRIGGTFLKVGKSGVDVLPSLATVARDAHETSTPTSSQPCADGNPGGAPPPAPDCGTRKLSYPLRLEFAPAATARDLLTLDGDLLSPLPPFQRCGVSGTSFPNLLQENGAGKPVGARFPKGDVFDPSQGKIIVIARATKTESLVPDHTSTTRIRWEVTFRRLKRKRSAKATMAAYRTGRYEGQTKQHLAISFRAGRRAVDRVTYAVRYHCSTGRSYTGNALTDSTSYAIRRGRFGGRSRSASGATRSEIHGRLSGSTASGTVQRTIRIDTANQRPDPNGDETCDSGVVRFTARRVKEGQR